MKHAASTLEALKKARALIADESRWFSWRLGRDYRSGIDHCAGTAIEAATKSSHSPLTMACYAALERVTGDCDVMAWNDAPGRTHAEVLAAFDLAIQRESAHTERGARRCR
jgi:hypothetical protein